MFKFLEKIPGPVVIALGIALGIMFPPLVILYLCWMMVDSYREKAAEKRRQKELLDKHESAGQRD